MLKDKLNVVENIVDDFKYLEKVVTGLKTLIQEKDEQIVKLVTTFTDIEQQNKRDEQTKQDLLKVIDEKDRINEQMARQIRKNRSKIKYLIEVAAPELSNSEDEKEVVNENETNLNEETKEQENDITFCNPSQSPGHTCIECDFVAKNTKGLRVHRKAKHKQN